MHYRLHLDEQFTVVFMTVSHSAQMLLKLEKCIPISHVTLETVPKYANIERPTSSQLYASVLLVLKNFPYCIKKDIMLTLPPKGGKFKNLLNKIIQGMHLFYISL